MGWSTTLKYDLGKYGSTGYTNPSAYSSVSGSWFFKKWWTDKRWAKKYTNDSSMPVKLSSMTFLACAGHSNGKQFYASNGLVPAVKGEGCTFGATLHVVGGESSSEYTCPVPDISQYNCRYNGVNGNVCTTADKTSFGDQRYFSGNRARQPKKFVFENSPVIPPGGIMYVVVRVVKWNSSEMDSLLVIKSDESSFDSEVVPAEDEKYIWRYNGKMWERVLPVNMYNGSEWIKIKGGV